MAMAPGALGDGGVRRRAHDNKNGSALLQSSHRHQLGLRSRRDAVNAWADGVDDNEELKDECPKIHKWSYTQRVDWILGSWFPHHFNAFCSKPEEIWRASSCRWLLAATILLVFAGVVTFPRTMDVFLVRRRPLVYNRKVEVVLPERTLFHKRDFHPPPGKIVADSLAEDHGGLQINSLAANTPFYRVITPEADYVTAENQRAEALAEDDASLVIPYIYWYDEDLDSLHFPCRRPAWVKQQYLNCNSFHEKAFDRDYQEGDGTNNCQEYDIYLTNHGYYRDVWVINKPSDQTNAIVKTTRYQFDFGWRSLFDVHREALIMERLTRFSNIVTAFGHCGTSVITEAVPHEVERYVVPGTGYQKQIDVHDDGNNAQPKNSLTAKEKLETALEMAESIAVLHGFGDGAIVHDDIQLQQWLRARDGSLKLGDFNRAAILDWNVKEQRYCKFNNGAAFGNVRSDAHVGTVQHVAL
jgi:hypothetical protein